MHRSARAKQSIAFSKRLWMMVFGIFCIGMGVGCLRLGSFGVDAFTCMNLGISGYLGMRFGNWQLLMNAVILVPVFLLRRKSIGPGTLVNMVGVGYMADLICWIVQNLLQADLALPLRVCAMALGLGLAALGVAFYMSADLGVSPYDAVGQILEQLTGGRLTYDRARVLSDVTVVAVGVLFCLLSGGNLWSILGIGTICNALFNGPLIQLFRTRITDPLLL